MAASFLGLLVLCRLHDGSTVEGVVISIDAVHGVLTLEPATVRRLNRSPYTINSQTLSRTEVAGLELLSTSKGASSAPTSEKGRSTGSAPSTPKSQPGAGAGAALEPHVGSSANNINNVPFPSAVLPAGNGGGGDTEEDEGETRTRRAPKGGRVKNKGSVREKDRSRGNGLSQVDLGNEADQSAVPYDDEVRSVGESSSGYRSHTQALPNPNAFTQDFDFIGSSSRFDKAKEFAHIRSQDETDPASRLVTHNRNQKHLVKLAPAESVLSPTELLEQQQRLPLQQLAAALRDREATDTSADETSEYEQSKVETERMRKVILKPTVTVPAPPPPQQQPSHSGNRGLVTLAGVKVAEVKLKQYKEVLSIADIETGPSAVQRAENGGRGVASFILQTLSRDRRLFPLEPRKRPHVCILVDDCDKGAVALRTGVHLANHGAKVVSYILTTQDHSELFKTNLRVFSSAGGRILRDIEDLPSGFDLLIDAIADNEVQAYLDAKSPAHLAAATWASASGVPILSIDSPFGVDHDTGTATTPTPIRPRYIASCGAVRTGSRSYAAEVVLIDVGFAPSLWNRVGLDEWDPATFGYDFIVPLKRG